MYAASSSLLNDWRLDISFHEMIALVGSCCFCTEGDHKEILVRSFTRSFILFQVGGR